MINVIAPNYPLALLWAKQNNHESIIYITDCEQVNRQYPIAIIEKYGGTSLEFSRDKRRLIREIEINHTRITHVEVR